MKVGGLESSTVEGLTFENVTLEGLNGGSVSWAENWQTEGLTVKASGKPLTQKNNVGTNLR